MKLIFRWILISGITLLLILGIWRFTSFSDRRSPGQDFDANARVKDGVSSGSAGSARDLPASSSNAAEFAAAHLTSISFYGKAIDQNGHPIPDATVTYRANNIPWGGGVRKQMQTDSAGKFMIDSNGLSLYVEVSKDNYRSLPRRSDIAPGISDDRPISSGTYPYAKQFGATAHQPDASHPVIFTLHKSGELEPLIIQSGKDWILAKDGSPIRIELNPGNPLTAIEIKCLTDDSTPNAERHYDWSFRMTVPAGGMLERTDEIAFFAPASGYDQRSFAYSMAKELPGRQWKDEVAKSFFIRFDDDTYAILDVNMIAGGGHFAVVKSRLNPKFGSRNLETAPPKKPRWR